MLSAMIVDLELEPRRPHFEYQSASKRGYQSELSSHQLAGKGWLGHELSESPFHFKPDLVSGDGLELGTNDTFTASKRLTAETEISLRLQERSLRSLSKDWDGYGSPGIDPTVIEAMVKDMRSVLPGLKCPPPDLIPGGDGSVQAEWHLHKLRLTYNIGADLERYLWVCERQSGEEHEYFEVDAREALAKWVPLLA